VVVQLLVQTSLLLPTKKEHYYLVLGIPHRRVVLEAVVQLMAKTFQDVMFQFQPTKIPHRKEVLEAVVQLMLQTPLFQPTKRAHYYLVPQIPHRGVVLEAVVHLTMQTTFLLSLTIPHVAFLSQWD
jgi:hypothetical protein